MLISCKAPIPIVELHHSSVLKEIHVGSRKINAFPSNLLFIKLSIHCFIFGSSISACLPVKNIIQSVRWYFWPVLRPHAMPCLPRQEEEPFIPYLFTLLLIIRERLIFCANPLSCLKLVYVNLEQAKSIFQLYKLLNWVPFEAIYWLAIFSDKFFLHALK